VRGGGPVGSLGDLAIAEAEREIVPIGGQLDNET
jgi:hypothetical protein